MSSYIDGAKRGAPSRLDKLLSLLHSGNEPARSAAARQLGEIQRQHPEQLHTLLQRVLGYLFSTTWETRRAAAAALEAIAEAVPAWCPVHTDGADAEAEAAARAEAEGAWLEYGSFDMGRVLEHGAPLLSSGGAEFEVEAAAGETPRQRLLKQKAALLEQLGQLGGVSRQAQEAIGARGREMLELVDEADLDTSKLARGGRVAGGEGGGEGGSTACGIVDELEASSGAASERARNAMKRRARLAQRRAPRWRASRPPPWAAPPRRERRRAAATAATTTSRLGRLRPRRGSPRQTRRRPRARGPRRRPGLSNRCAPSCDAPSSRRRCGPHDLAPPGLPPLRPPSLPPLRPNPPSRPPPAPTPAVAATARRGRRAAGHLARARRLGRRGVRRVGRRQ